MHLSIIIVSYNTQELVCKCLDSIIQSNDRLKKEVIVVDNHSTDATVSVVREKYPWVQLVVNPENYGFGRANNLAAAKAQGKYLLFLNSDTLVFPDSLTELYDKAVAADSDLASCRLVNADGSTQPQGGALPTLFKVFLWQFFIDDLPGVNVLTLPYQQRRATYFNLPQKPGWLAATALLVKKTTFSSLHGFDDRIFMYAEDVELCYRAQKAHHSINYFPSPYFSHLGQGSGSSQTAIVGEYQGLIYLYSKHRSALAQFCLKCYLKIGSLLRLFVFGIIQKDENKKVIYSHVFNLV
jgi:hypothetical protein